MKAINYFEQATEVRVARDNDTGKIRGFAHIAFETAAMAEDCVAVMESMGGLEIDGRKVYCEVPRGNGEMVD